MPRLSANAEFNDVYFSFNELVLVVYTVDVGGFSLVMMFHLYDGCNEWKFPHVVVWVLTVIKIPSCGWLIRRSGRLKLRDLHGGNLPYSFISLRLFEYGLLGIFWESCMGVCGFVYFSSCSDSYNQHRIHQC